MPLPRSAIGCRWPHAAYRCRLPHTACRDRLPRTADGEPQAVRVVTSDRWLADRAYAAGASVEPAAPFRSLIEDD